MPRTCSECLAHNLEGFTDADRNYFDGAKTYKVTLPPNIPSKNFWSFTFYDNQTRSMLQTPKPYPRAGSQSYPTPAADAKRGRLTTISFAACLAEHTVTPKPILFVRAIQDLPEALTLGATDTHRLGEPPLNSLF